MSGPIVECSSACTVTVLLEVAPATTEHIDDMGTLWSLFLVVVIVVFCLRKLYDVFQSSPHES